jgi:hypothetical protein
MRMIVTCLSVEGPGTDEGRDAVGEPRAEGLALVPSSN